MPLRQRMAARRLDETTLRVAAAIEHHVNATRRAWIEAVAARQAVAYARQVADAARMLRPKLKVLFITGYAENAVLSHGHLEPGMQVVTKPFAVEDLARRIRGILSDN